MKLGNRQQLTSQDCSTLTAMPSAILGCMMTTSLHQLANATSRSWRLTFHEILHCGMPGRLLSTSNRSKSKQGNQEAAYLS